MSESVAGQSTGSTHQNLTAGESEQDARAQKLARTGVPYALNTAAAWSWRLIVVVGAVWLVWQGLSKVSLLIISAMVAALLAALLSPPSTLCVSTVFVLAVRPLLPNLA